MGENADEHSKGAKAGGRNCSLCDGSQRHVPKACRVLSARMEAGWTVIDLQTHGQPLCLRWSI